jgi:predicted Zn-dependent protease
MKNLRFIAFILISLFIFSCSTVPLTNRKQLAMIPQGELLAMSFAQYDAFLDSTNVSSNQEQTEMVKRVGRNIEGAVVQYLYDNNYSQLLEGFDWEFNLVDDPQVNAWCMPGGKVVVYTGILPIAQDEAGLAVVMGHEIAHAIADHGNERMSQGLLQQYGGVALAVAMQNKPEETQALWMTAYGVGTYYGAMLPYSRLHESEADHLGLIFMAIAGYNPQASIPFWQRMADASGGQAPPEFMSTHPSHETRISNLQKWMPEALKYYDGDKGTGGPGKPGGSGTGTSGDPIKVKLGG